MLKYISLVIFLNLSTYAAASACTYDFNQDTLCDSFTITPTEEHDELFSLKITLGNGKEISGSFNMISAGIAPGYFPGEIVIPLDFYSPNTIEQRTYTFRWSNQAENWILIKESSWDEPYREEIYALKQEPIPKEKKFPTNFHVQRIQCCVLLSDFKEKAPTYQALSKQQQTAAIDEDIAFLKKALTSEKKDSLLYKTTSKTDQDNRKPIPPDFVYELSTALKIQNVEFLNNYAFYMQEAGNTVLSTMLLEKIHQKFPDRIVTKINLADGYWELGMKDTACHFYHEYIEDMENTGRSAKIPLRAKRRADCKTQQ